MKDFYASLPTFDAFERIVDADSYRPLPDDWVIGVADVVSSTVAVAEGRYKAVNLAGAAVVSAVSNVIGTLDFPYVFTGDGMVCAVSPDDAGRLRRTLATTIGWVGTALQLELRGGTASVAEIRAAGHDVRVARFKPSSHVAYAMFSGGGLAWMDAALKSGALPLIAQDLSDRPDLSGLSCRFKPMPSQQGIILSLIVAPRLDQGEEPFRMFIGELLSMIGTGAGNPVPASGPDWGWPPAGWEFEARLRAGPGRSLVLSRLAVGVRTLLAAAIVKLGRPVGGFSPSRYRGQIAGNSDFRKFEDGLMMTIDCSSALADAIAERLSAARADQIADFGMHRQASALLTCVVPSPSHPEHIHFVDGADGGYTVAARNLKQSRADGTRVPDDEYVIKDKSSGASP